MTWATDLGVNVSGFILEDEWAPLTVESESHARSLIEDPRTLVCLDAEGDPTSFKALLERLGADSSSLRGVDAGKASKRGRTPPKLPPKARAFHGCVFGRAYWMGVGTLGGNPALLTQEVHVLVGRSFALTLRYRCQGWDLVKVATEPTYDPEPAEEPWSGFNTGKVRKDVMDLRDRRDALSRDVFGVEVAAAVFDQILDSVFDSLDRLRDEQADKIEEEILGRKWLWMPERKATRPTLDDRMLGLRRLLRQIRWAFLPSDEIEEFLSGPFLGTKDPVVKFKFKDLEREADRAVVAVKDLIEQVDQSAQLSAAMRSDRLNKTMYVLTAVATVLLVPTVIAGIYGMNFRHMPELGWRMGYWSALGAMIVLGTGMWFAIRGFLKASGGSRRKSQSAK